MIEPTEAALVRLMIAEEAMKAEIAGAQAHEARANALRAVMRAAGWSLDGEKETGT